MSAAGPRIPLAQAQEAAAYLARLWKLGDARDCVVGSVRRQKPTVGDLEFIAPLPEDPREDPVFRTIAGTVDRPQEEQPRLFGAPPPLAGTPIGTALMGLKPGFKMCRLQIRGRSGNEMQVEINRYTPGPKGNRGWVQLVKTGPEDFGKAVLTHWKVLNRIGPEHDGSRDFFLLSADGAQVPTANELQVLHACRLLWVAPELRCAEALACVDWVGSTQQWQRQRLVKALGILGLEEADVEVNFREQSYARLSAGAAV